MRRFLLFALSLSLTCTAFAQEGFSLFTTDFPPEEFASRRAGVYDAIGKGAVAILQGAPTPAGYTRFRQSNDFYYLSGVEVPNAYLLLDAASRKATLYLPHRNEGRERGEGKVLCAEDAEEVKKLSGVEDVAGTNLLGEHLARLLQGRAADRLPAALSPGRSRREPRSGPAPRGGARVGPVGRPCLPRGQFRSEDPGAFPEPDGYGSLPRSERFAADQESEGDRDDRPRDAPVGSGAHGSDALDETRPVRA
ncbi:MAG TPA: aminopeptidase P N-terminal domain-containing protein [Thermoanaerobaculia bacterium]|nr:aminopeptidase P N-terminal domain-containing protein [Thermoanaerobaculia bacterium]